MRVEIQTACVWEGKRREAGSVIEVPAEIFELNSSWMKPTDDAPKDAPAAKGSKSADES